MTEMEKELIRALAKIDDALGMPQDSCNDLDSTITAIELLHAIVKDDDKIIKSSEKRIAELEEKLKWAGEALAFVSSELDAYGWDYDSRDGIRNKLREALDKMKG